MCKFKTKNIYPYFQETSLLQTVEQRQKIEKALRKGDETAGIVILEISTL